MWKRFIPPINGPSPVTFTRRAPTKKIGSVGPGTLLTVVLATAGPEKGTALAALTVSPQQRRWHGAHQLHQPGAAGGIGRLAEGGGLVDDRRQPLHRVSERGPQRLQPAEQSVAAAAALPARPDRHRARGNK